MPLFLDMTPLNVTVTDEALEYIYKASSAGGGDDGIWSPHESKLIRRIVELFTQRGLDRLEQVKKELLAWQAGEMAKPSVKPIAKPGMMERWSTAELGMVKLYLESLPPSAWTLEDHMMAVDFVVQRYLPADELKTEAEWLSVRSGLMGKVQSEMDAPASTQQADEVLAALPSTVTAASDRFPSLGQVFKAQMEYGYQRCAENVRALSETVRHKMRNVIMEHVAANVAGSPTATQGQLEQRLSEEFATLNRDWRRIAVTEAGECQLQGFVSALKPGTKVKRVEQYRGACGFCRKIDGTVAEVVSPDTPDKDGNTQIWPGKTNVGRSASPRKRVGDVLVPRTEDELWWLPAGTAHPHCRGRWVRQIEDQPGDDPVFGDWLRATLGS